MGRTKNIREKILDHPIATGFAVSGLVVAGAFTPFPQTREHTATAYCVAGNHAVFAEGGTTRKVFDGKLPGKIALACVKDGDESTGTQQGLVDLRDADTPAWARHQLSPGDGQYTVEIHCGYRQNVLGAAANILAGVPPVGIYRVNSTDEPRFNRELETMSTGSAQDLTCSATIS